MNIPHLQETAKHYANLAEQYRSELAEEQELNEDLMNLIEALCEELDIDVEALLEMAFTLDAAKASRKRIRAADKERTKAERKAKTYFLPSDHPAEKKYDAELARHQEQGSSDTIHGHDPATGEFPKVGELPKGSARKIVDQGNRAGRVKMSGKRVEAIRAAAEKHGGIVASRDYDDPEVDPRDQDTVVPSKPRTGDAITKPNRYARDWGRG